MGQKKAIAKPQTCCGEHREYQRQGKEEKLSEAAKTRKGRHLSHHPWYFEALLGL